MTSLILHDIIFPVGGFDCDGWHRQIQTLFPDMTREQAGYTYRIYGTVARVRSQGPTLKSSKVSIPLERGRQYLFELRGNTVKKIPHKDGGKNSVRVPEKDWTAWLMRQQKGFVVRSFQPRVAPKAVGIRKDNGFKMTFTGVDFAGILECTDEVEMALALANGLGPGKPYGFGQLLVEPI